MSNTTAHLWSHLLFDETSNDGTIIIWSGLDRPTQGTWIAECDDKSLVVAKGVFRWQAHNPYTGEIERPGMVRQAAFGREMIEGINGKVYPIKEIGDETCRLNGQTTLFSVRDPAAVIRHDNRSIKKRAALDLVSRETRRKIESGVSPGLLMDEMAPWKLMTTYKGDGVRSIAFGSHLVPDEMMEHLADESEDLGSLATAFVNAGIDPADFDHEENEPTSWFMLGQITAEKLARQFGAEEVDEVRGKWFLISRDPALPNATGLYPARFAGIMKWANGSEKYQEGVWLNPGDSRWKAAQGDFDGDSASVFVLSQYLRPRDPQDKFDLRTGGELFNSDDPGEQMIQALENSVTGLLGPTILGTAKLFERGLDREYRETASTVAQASVDAKKYPVNVEETMTLYTGLRKAIYEGEEGGSYPYISSYTNRVKQARGGKGKVTAWKVLYTLVSEGMWDTHGTPLEQALCERIQLLNQLFVDTEFFRAAVRAELPSSMKKEAEKRASRQALSTVESMAASYIDIVRRFQKEEELDTEEKREGHRAVTRDMLRRKQASFRLAAINGNCAGDQFEVKDVRFALIAKAPARLAARYVPADSFEEVGLATSMVIVNLFGKGWEEGEYLLDDIDPIPSCAREVDRLKNNAATFGATRVELQIVSNNPKARSTRCALTIVPPEA